MVKMDEMNTKDLDLQKANNDAIIHLYYSEPVCAVSTDDHL